MLKYALLGVLAIGLIGCSSNSATDNSSTASSSSTTSAAVASSNAPDTTTSSATSSSDASASSTAPKTGPATAKAGDEVAVIDTNLGRIIFKLRPDMAPETVKNFVTLAKKGFYDGTKFHRVIPGFMIQGGDPNSKGSDRSSMGTGGPGYTIKDEFNDLHHGPGTVSMAHTGAPNSGGSQFFIMVGDKSYLDHAYSGFGQVVEGMDVADKIVRLSRDENDNPLDANPAIIKSIKIEKWPVK